MPTLYSKHEVESVEELKLLQELDQLELHDAGELLLEMELLDEEVEVLLNPRPLRAPAH